MKGLLPGILLLATVGLTPTQLLAAGPRDLVTETRSRAIEAGGGWVEYLICIRENHLMGASWDTAAGSCMNPTAHATGIQRQSKPGMPRQVQGRR